MHSNMRIQADSFSEKIGMTQSKAMSSIGSKNVGDIISGTIVKTKDGSLGVRTQKEDETLLLPKERHFDYEVGKPVELRIAKKTKERIEIEIRQSSQTEINSREPLSQSINMDKVKESMISTENPLRYVENIENMIMETGKRIEQMMSRFSDSQLGSMIESGYDVTRMTIDTLYQVGHSGKVDKKIALEGDKKLELSITVNEEQIDASIKETIESMPMNHMDTERATKIIEALQDKDMAVTLRSVEKLDNMLKKTDQIREMSSEDQLRFLSSNKDGTLGELYKSIYASNGSLPNQVMSESDYAQIAKDVEGIVARYAEENGMNQQVDALVGRAKEALMHGIPVDERTLDLFSLSMDDSVSDGELLDKGIQMMDQGESVSQMKLLHEKKGSLLSHDEVQQIVDIVQNTEEEDIETVVKHNDPLSIDNLQKSQEKGYDKETDREQPVDMSRVDSGVKDLDVLRYQMTFKTAMRLNIEGMDLQHEQLSTIRQRIEQMEAEDMQVAQDVQTEETSQKEEAGSPKEQWQALRRTVAMVNGASTESIAEVAMEETEVSLEQLANKVQKGADRYDALRTMPRKDLGDRVEKAFQNVDAILDDLEMEQSVYNRRAVEILGRNQMPITVETIQQVKALDIQLQTLITNLDPSIVKTLVEEGENLLTMPLDQLAEQVQILDEGMKAKDGTSLAKRVQMVMDMEGVSPETKEAVLGTYRLVHTIQSNKGAAVGFLMKNDMQPTLEHLFDASKYMKQQSHSSQESGVVEHVVDDTLGLLERVEKSTMSIKEQISQGVFEKKMNLDVFLNQLVSGKSEALSTEARQVMEQTQATVNQEAVKELRSALDILSKSQDIKSFMKNHPDLEMSIEEWEGFAKMVKDGQWLKNALNTVINDRSVSAEVKEGLKSAVETVFEKPSNEAYEQLSKALDSVHEDMLEQSYIKRPEVSLQSEDLTKVTKTLEAQLQVQKALENDMPTAIPIWINGEMQQMNMFYQRRQATDMESSEQSMSIYMSFTTKHMGVTNIRVDFAGENTDVTLYATTDYGQEQLQENETSVKTVLEGIGMPVDRVRFERFEVPTAGNVEQSKRNQRHIKRYHSSQFEHVI